MQLNSFTSLVEFVRLFSYGRRFTISSGLVRNLSYNKGSIVFKQTTAQEDSSTLENTLRYKLAAFYRIVHSRGWDMGIYNHITARLPDTNDLLVNPFGLLYDEITPDNLVKIGLNDVGVEQHDSQQSGVNQAAIVLHTSVHESRADLCCTAHVHIPEVIAVASYKDGLLALSQEAIIIRYLCGVSYHDYEGILLDPSMSHEITEDLGPRNKIMLMRHHGVLVCGASVEETFFFLDTLIMACKTQIEMLSLAGGDLQKIVPVRQLAFDNMNRIKENFLSVDNRERANNMKMDIGVKEFRAELRRLNRMGLISN